MTVEKESKEAIQVQETNTNSTTKGMGNVKEQDDEIEMSGLLNDRDLPPTNDDTTDSSNTNTNTNNNAMKNDSKAVDTPMFVYILSILATIGGFLLGYDIGIVAGSMLFIGPFFDLSTVWHELIVSGLVGAAAVAALFAGWLTDKIGRKPTIMASSVLFTLGGIIMAAAASKEALLLGRVVGGLGVGLASVVVPIYVAEASPPHIRGRLVSLYQACINTGIVISSIIAGAFSYVEPDGWRYMLGMAAVPGIIQFIGFFFMPESPRWLIDRGRPEQAKEVLARTRGHRDVTKEFDEILFSVEEAKKEESAGGIYHLMKIVKTPHVRRALFIGCSLTFFQALCGINTVIYYSGTLLKMAGFPVKYAIWLVVVPNAILFFSNFIGLYLVDRVGRRPLLIGSFAGTIVGLIILAVGFQLAADSPPGLSPNIIEIGSDGLVITECHSTHSTCASCVKDHSCGFCYSNSADGSCLPSDNEEFSTAGRCNKTAPDMELDDVDMNWAYEYCPSDYTYVALVGMVVFVFAFSPGLGPMPWTINAEIYPLWARGTCNSLAAFTVWVCNLIISFLFLTLTENITIYGTFWLFTAISLVGVALLYFVLPETKDKTLEEVEQLFMTSAQRHSLMAANEIKDKQTGGKQIAPTTL